MPGRGRALHCGRIDVSHSIAVRLHRRAEGDNAGGKGCQVIASIEESHDAAHQGERLLQLCQRLSGHRRGSNRVCVNFGHGIAIGFHGCAKGHDTRRESAKVIAPIEESHDAANIGQIGLELRQGLGGNGGGSNGLSLNIRHSLTIRFHSLPEGDNPFCKFTEVVPTGKELHDAAHIGKGCLQLSQRLSRHSRGGYSPGVNTGNGIAIGFHRLSKGQNAIGKCSEIIPTGEELHHSTHTGKRCLERGKRLSRSHRGGYRPRIHSGHSISIGLHALAKGKQTIRKGLQIVPTGKEVHYAADIGQRALQFRQCFRRGRGGRDCFAVHTGHTVGIGLHRLSERRQLVAEGFQIVVTSEESDQTSGIRDSLCKLYQGFAGNSRVGNGIAIQAADRF